MIIAFASDTVFGLGVRIDSSQGLDQLYQLKQRPENQPMQILVANRAMAARLVRLKLNDPIDYATRLYQIHEKAVLDPRLVRDGVVGIRQPNHQGLCAYIEQQGVGLAASSANHRGEPPLMDCASIQLQFPTIPIVVRGGVQTGASSPIWDMCTSPPKRLR